MEPHLTWDIANSVSSVRTYPHYKSIKLKSKLFTESTSQVTLTLKRLNEGVTVTTVVSLTSCAPALDNTLLPSTTRCCPRQCAARCYSRQCAAALDNVLLPQQLSDIAQAFFCYINL
jgi:adenine C2-methylase RlmN of 23S rRNA A2503 and tRNA A37